MNAVLTRPPLSARIDINAHAARVVSASARAVRRALEFRARLDAAGKADQILVILAGETHDIPAHYAHHIMFASGLADAAAVAVALEAPHDVAEKYLKLPGDPRVREKDATGRLSLSIELATADENPEATHARATWQGFLLRRRLPVCFNDVSLRRVPDDGSFIDSAEPSSAAMMLECLGETSSWLDAHVPAGMWVRNRHMARLGLSFARASGARILFQHCGALHVVGGAAQYDHRYAPAHSLAAEYGREGAAVLAAPYLTPYFTAEKLSVRGTGLEEPMFVRGLPHVTADQDESADMLSASLEETEYVNGLLDAGGFKEDCLTASEHDTRKYDHVRRLFRVYQDMRKPDV